MSIFEKKLKRFHLSAIPRVSFYKRPMIYLGLLILCGSLTGLMAFLFLKTLNLVTDYRLLHPLLIFTLPLVGLILRWFHQNTLGLNFIHASLTHLAGGSAGREGAIVQMSAQIAQRVTKVVKLTETERKFFLVAAIGAGFSAAIGVPFAGMIFGLEAVRDQESVHHDPDHGFFKDWRSFFFVIVLCFFMAQLSHYSSLWFGSHHAHYEKILVPEFHWVQAIYWVILGLIFGGVGLMFKSLTHVIKKSRLPAWLAGCLLAGLFYAEGTHRFEGLGVLEISRSFAEHMSLSVPFLKLAFTAFTLGAGFKGGNFTPLVFIGTTLGSALSAYFPFSVSYLAALGFVGVFAGLGQAPFACTVMAVELFGAQVALPSWVVCMISALIIKRIKLK